MSRERKTVEIDSLETPDGFVPTVKGLENLVNKIYTDFSPVATVLDEITKAVGKLSTDVATISESFNKLGENMASFLVLLAKIEARMKVLESMTGKLKVIETEINSKGTKTAEDSLADMVEVKLQELKSQELNLIKIQESLAKLVLKLELVTKAIPLTYD